MLEVDISKQLEYFLIFQKNGSVLDIESRAKILIRLVGYPELHIVGKLKLISDQVRYSAIRPKSLQNLNHQKKKNCPRVKKKIR